MKRCRQFNRLRRHHGWPCCWQQPLSRQQLSRRQRLGRLLRRLAQRWLRYSPESLRQVSRLRRLGGERGATS